MRLESNFYKQDALTLAKSLLGKLLVRVIEQEKIVCRIVETEAYLGPEDRACHAYKGLKTKRTAVMFEEGGLAYVYLIYGMHHCLNVVAGPYGKPEAVLIRGVEPLTSLTSLFKNRKVAEKKNLTNGPGKLCQALAIDKSFNGYNLITGKQLYIMDSSWQGKIIETTRINIPYAQDYIDKPWRFYIEANEFVSKK